GIICAAEQSVICPREKYDDIMAEFERSGAYVIRESAEKEALKNAMFEDGAMNRHATGQSAADVAALARIPVPLGTKIIVVPASEPGAGDIFSKEKMCPVIAAYSYGDFKEAVEIARENLETEGKGHSVAIHSNTVKNIEYAGEELCVSRFLINQPCAGSAGGSFYNGLAPTNTMGCGSWGHNSISENLDYKHLINISRIAYYMPDNHVPDDEELWN
ncbi:MAG: succinate-semialdehyde dehydrogenase, partial [Clostridiales bacterium]|nr:succinate-semialdehyde dehydrogenase [Clostridiales bacterium]